MGRKTIVAVGDKTIEQFISSMPQVDVLSCIRKREQIFDKVIDLNPHSIILSNDLGGKEDFINIIPKLREFKPHLKIIFLYGNKNDEFRYFANFLVENGVYNILVDDIDDFTLQEAIVNDYGLVDVEQYLLSKEETTKELFKKEEEKQQKKIEEQQQFKPLITPNIEKELEVLFVEKIIEKETIQTQYVGNIKIGVGSLYERAGCTHFSIELATYLLKMKKDVGVVVNPATYNALQSYHMIQGSEVVINKVPFYSNPTMALNNHKCVIYDVGVLAETDDKNTIFYEMNCKVLLCPSQPWEIDKITNFVTTSEFVKKIDYVFYPITDKYFKEIEVNFRRNGCRAYKMQYNPDCFLQNKENFKMYQKVTFGIINSL